MEDIRAVVEQMEMENDKELANDPSIKLAIRTVEAFIKEARVMCYGGTAINNLLPPEARFYDPEYDIPDYDFFSENPQEDAMKLADRLHKAGIKSVEVKPAVHLGTFKVFANYEGVADITHLNTAIFKQLWEEKETVRGIHYVPPDFLRMATYLELSRPKGDVSRWMKIYNRLMLLNKYHPIVCEDMPDPEEPITEEHKKRIQHILEKEAVVLLGITAAQIHLRHKEAWAYPISLLADKSTVEKLVKDEKDTEEHDAIEILPRHVDVKDKNGKVWMRIYETVACHSYHKMANGVYVASIPTLLHFYLASIFAGHPETERARLLCTAQRIVDISTQKNKRRYELLTPVDCLGKQPTLVDLREEKSAMFERLSKHKSSADFLTYFFTYNPSDTPKEKQKLREALRKTRKTRIATLY